jgi:TonB family protein
MTFGSIFLGALLAIALQQSPASTTERACVGERDQARRELCLGDQAVRRADALPSDSAERADALNTAADLYGHALQAATQPGLKIDALKLLAQCYDRRHLNEVAPLETVLREWIRLAPSDLSPVDQLARLQEDEGFIEVAEQMLLDARHQQPDSVDANTMLMQFYARRLGVLQQTSSQLGHDPTDTGSGPDASGIYRVGGSIAKPAQLNLGETELVAETPGRVVAEITIDQSGRVIEDRVIRSDSALLDEAARQAVRSWRFQPTYVNGQPVIVRMNVTVNFVPPQIPPPTR